MNKILKTLAFLAFVATSSSAVAGLIFQPVGITSDMGLCCGSSYSPEKAINQSNLNDKYVSGVTDLDTYLATNPTHSDSNNWIGTHFASAVTGNIIFDLGQSLEIDTFLYWGLGTTGNDQSFRNIALHASNDNLFSSFVNLGNFEFSLNNSPSDSSEVQLANFSSVNARYFRVVVQSNWGADRSTISEGAFGQVSVSEPSTIALFGLLLIALSRRFTSQ